jgi:hypothetical protein
VWSCGRSVLLFANLAIIIRSGQQRPSALELAVERLAAAGEVHAENLTADPDLT